MSSSDSDSESENQEYPLQDTWSFKYRKVINYKKGQTVENWIDTFKLIYNISDAIIFWQVYNNLTWEKTVYSLFKKGIEPMWEDPKNKNGFSLHYYAKDRQFLALTILALIGGTMPDYESVNGMTFDTKRSKISIWYSCSRTKELVDSIEKIVGTPVQKLEDHARS